MAIRNVAKRRPFRAATFLTIALTATIGLAACSQASNGNTSAASKSLTIAAPKGSPNLDPRVDSTDFILESIDNNVVEPLTVLDPTTNKIAPLLATSWKQNSDDQWTIDLRHNVKFSDGTPMTAADVVATFNFEKQGNTTAYGQSLNTVSGVVAVDDHTLQFTTTAPDPVLPSRLRYMWVMPASETGDIGANKPIGTGPYQVKSYETGTSLTLSANSHYWGKKGDFTTVNYEIRDEDSVRVAALNANEASIALEITSQEAKQVPRLLSSKGLEVAGYNLNTTGQTEGSIMTDVRVRQAVNMAVDRKALIKAIFGGRASLPGGQYNPSYFLGADPKLKDWAYDPKKAKQLIQQAGDTGKEIRIFVGTGLWDQALPLSEALVPYFQAIGLVPKITTVDSAGWSQAYYAQSAGKNAPYDLFVSFHNNTFLDSTIKSAKYLTSLKVGGGNWMINDPTVDKLVPQVLAETNLTKRYSLMQKVWDEVRNQADLLPIAVPDLLTGVAKNVVWTPRSDGLVLLNTIHLN